MLISCIMKSVSVQHLHRYGQSKTPFKIGFVDGIFACKLRFLYGQRSKCADLLNSYTKSINIEILW